MRVVFFGTPEFAVPSLHALAERGFSISCVVTRPARPRGRGMSRVVPPPVAAAATGLGLKVVQPERPSDPDFLDLIRGLEPDVLAVAAYSGMLPDGLLASARTGAWNVHPSLLPRWRGPAPIHRAIWAGDSRAGVTIIKLVSRMDAGPVAVQASLEIGPRETRGELERRLADLGAALLTETLGKMADGGVRLTEQDESAATYAPRFKPEEAEVHWDRTAVELDRLIRALAPAPGAFFLFGSERVKILAAAPAAPSKSGMPQAAPGSLGRDGAAWTVTCGEGCLGIDTVQPEGKTAMPFSAFAAGRRLKAGDRLA